MLIPASQTSPSFSYKLAKTLTRRRHGQDDETSGGSGGSEAPNDGLVATSASGSTTPTVSTPQVTSDPSFPNPTATSNSNDTVLAFQFMDVQNATTCQNYTISWSYNSANRADFALFVAENYWGPNITAARSSNRRSPPLLRMLSSDITSNSTNFIWGSVDLREGWYMLNARPMKNQESTGVFPQSAPLYVTNGTDTSCVKPSKPISSPHPRLNTGDIVAIIIGAVAAAGLLAVAFAFPRLWRRDLPSPKKRRPYYLY